MLTVIRQVNLCFPFTEDLTREWGKVSFQTILDSALGEKRYYVIENNTKAEVSLEAGNLLFHKYRKEHPNSKALVIIDKEAKNEVSYLNVRGHYEVYRNGSFFESCDSQLELRDAMARAKK